MEMSSNKNNLAFLLIFSGTRKVNIQISSIFGNEEKGCDTGVCFSFGNENIFVAQKTIIILLIFSFLLTIFKFIFGFFLFPLNRTVTR